MTSTPGIEFSPAASAGVGLMKRIDTFLTEPAGRVSNVVERERVVGCEFRLVDARGRNRGEFERGGLARAERFSGVRDFLAVAGHDEFERARLRAEVGDRQTRMKRLCAKDFAPQRERSDRGVRDRVADRNRMNPCGHRRRERVGAGENHLGDARFRGEVAEKILERRLIVGRVSSA